MFKLSRAGASKTGYRKCSGDLFCSFSPLFARHLLTNTHQLSRLSRWGFGLNRQTHAGRGVKSGYVAGAAAVGSLPFAGAPTV